MALYFFHIDNGTFAPDRIGADLPDLEAARIEAVRTAGEVITNAGGVLWQHRTQWVMHVTDERDRLVLTLEFAAKIPSGPARYIP